MVTYLVTYCLLIGTLFNCLINSIINIILTSIDIQTSFFVTLKLYRFGCLFRRIFSLHDYTFIYPIIVITSIGYK